MLRPPDQLRAKGHDAVDRPPPDQLLDLLQDGFERHPRDDAGDGPHHKADDPVHQVLLAAVVPASLLAGQRRRRR